MYSTDGEAMIDYARKSIHTKDVQEVLQLESAQYLLDKGAISIKDIEGLIKDNIEHEKADKACDELFDIIKKINIWNLGKFNDDLIRIKGMIGAYDKNYVQRRFLYEQIIELPKFKGLDEYDKLRIAMQLGALDFSELGLEE